MKKKILNQHGTRRDAVSWLRPRLRPCRCRRRSTLRQAACCSACSGIPACSIPKSARASSRSFAMPSNLSPTFQKSACCMAWHSASIYRCRNRSSSCASLTRQGPDCFIARLKFGEMLMRLRICDQAAEQTQKAAELAVNDMQADLARRQATTIRTMRREGIERGGLGQILPRWVPRGRKSRKQETIPVLAGSK